MSMTLTPLADDVIERFATVPAANAVLQEAPHEIGIRFSERVEARASSLRVFDAHGTRLDDGTAADFAFIVRTNLAGLRASDFLL